jgi:hypothetical protein
MFGPEVSMKPRSIGGCVIAAAIVAASLTSAAAQRGGGASQQAAGAPTPRMTDGHPDLNGWWGGGGGGFGGGRTLADLTDEKGNVTLQLNARSQGSALGTSAGQLAENFERDSGVRQRADPNKPIYKPEYWDKVQDLDVNGSAKDPTFNCGPAGVPRMGFPNKIVMNPTEVVFLHDNENTFRWIPINKPHHAERDPTYKGDSVAKWEGDTLIIDTNNFNDETWLGWPGYFHSDELHVVEKLTRAGNTIRYEVVVEDPQVLQKPWVWAPRMIQLNMEPNAAFWEDPPCKDEDLQHIVTKERG